MSDLQKLAKPFDPRLVQTKPGKFQAEYVSHSEVVQKLLIDVGTFDFEVTQSITDPDGTISGCLALMRCEIDGKIVTIVEAGECERPENVKTNGARLKNAASDALKRCAMRVGVGLHLWAQDKYALDKALAAE
jgi:hypothetical protein